MIATIIEVGRDYVAVECKQGQFQVKVSPLEAPQYSIGEQVIFGPSELHEMLMPNAKPMTLKETDPDGNIIGEMTFNPGMNLWGIPDTAPEYTRDGQHRDHLRRLPGTVNKMPGAKPLRLPETITSSHGVTLRTDRIIEIFGDRVLYVEPDDLHRLTDEDRRETEQSIGIKLSCPAIVKSIDPEEMYVNVAKKAK